jgi:hypothetical protein
MHAGLLDVIEELAAEEGETVESARTGLEEMHATMAFMTRRFLMVAEAA